MTTVKTLPMIVEVPSKGSSYSVGLAEVSVDVLRTKLTNSMAALSEVFSDIGKVGDFHLSEVSIGIEVSAEGGIHFIGTTKVAGSGSITLKFTNPDTTALME